MDETFIQIVLVYLNNFFANVLCLSEELVILDRNLLSQCTNSFQGFSTVYVAVNQVKNLCPALMFEHKQHILLPDASPSSLAPQSQCVCFSSVCQS